MGEAAPVFDRRQLTRRDLLGRALVAAGAVGAAPLLSACGSEGEQLSGSGRRATFVTDVAPYGKHAPFYVAQAQGWSQRDLSVDIQIGKGSADAITKVGAGAGDFALADASAAFVARGNGNLDVRLVAMYHYRNLMAELTLESSGIKEPQHLVGSTQQSTAGDATIVLLPALAELNGFDPNGVTVNTADFTTHVQNIVSGLVDGALTYLTLYPALEAAAEQAGLAASSFLYADYGLDLYNNGIVVSDRLIDRDPDLVRDFVEGFIEAVAFTVKDPGAAIEIFTSEVPGFDVDIARAQLDIAIEHLNVPEVSEVGFGPMSDSKMMRTVDLVNQHFDLNRPIELDEVYTNAFASAGTVPEF